MPATELSTRAAFSVTAMGRYSPLASAKPATVPLGSATAREATENTVPLVPTDTTTSPGSAPRPRRGGRVVPGAGTEQDAVPGSGRA